MSANTFGNYFRVTTFGESHGPAVGTIVDGCPAGLRIKIEEIQHLLRRRRPGQSILTTPRNEYDNVTILSGMENDTTLGTPIAMSVANSNTKPIDYANLSDIPRPSHADYTTLMKFGRKASSGGGRASARETSARVAASAIAEKLLEQIGVEIVGFVSAVGQIEAADIDLAAITRAEVDTNITRCPDKAAAVRMEELILATKDREDSVGGVVTCICRNVPAGWGEPVFDKLEATLAHAMLSIPATRGFEIGAGFAATRMHGSEHNDPFYRKSDGTLGTLTNHSGGIQGGISNGEPIIFRVAFKPASTIGLPQQTVTYEGESATLEAKGRHDPCVLPRAVPIVEAMAALALADAALAQRARLQ